MNKVILMGRLVREPEVRYTQTETYSMCIARYTLAVDRKKTSKEEQAQTDFIGCVAFGKQGEFAEKYFTKGMKICVTGRIQTGSYINKDGQKVYTEDVVCEEQEFCESRHDSDNSSRKAHEGFSVVDGIDDDLPFAKAR